MQGYIDFGSECSLITLEATRFLSLEKHSCGEKVRLFTLAGAHINPKFMTTAEVSICNIKRTIDFYVVEECILGVHILIGQNFTELFDINYFRIGNELRFTENFIRDINVNLLEQTTLQVGLEDPRVEKALLDLLREYPNCVARNLSEIGCTNLTEMEIELTSTKPIACRPRQFSDYERTQ